MKQIITIEIENDTGVEFEEVAHIKRVKEGQYYIGSYGDLMKMEAPCTAGYHVVLTPKVDHELEEAKRKFPVGSYYTTTERMSGVFAKVESVERVELREKNRVCVITSDICSTVESCTPFPIPTWRCCESDKPKTTERKHFHVRCKESAKPRGVNTWFGEAWAYDCIGEEWLDEGGE